MTGPTRAPDLQDLAITLEEWRRGWTVSAACTRSAHMTCVVAGCHCHCHVRAHYEAMLASLERSLRRKDTAGRGSVTAPATTADPRRDLRPGETHRVGEGADDAAQKEHS